MKAARNPVTGADRVARFFAGIYGPGRRLTVRRVELNGQPGALIVRPDAGRYALTLAAAGGRITAFHVVGNPDKLRWAN
ncbi:hypothetical protein ACSNN9_27830 [Micromonospora sp. URMC 107]|uniref:hypothetical protein n=1 Tax=Micromonospora sp. URMC 107 TaxID=3423418 RepID=UPI003F1A145D